MKLANRVFVITGGGNGIGRQLALDLVNRGSRVAAVDYNADGLLETRRRAGSREAQIRTHVVNVADRSAVTALPKAVLSEHGQVDGVVDVAGIIQRFAPMSELTFDELERIVDVNMWGTVYVSLAFLPLLRERQESSLVNVSSLSALVAFAGQTFYGATKGAVKQFSEGLYEELADSTVAVTTVFPGNVSTDLSGNSGVEMIDAGSHKVRATTPEAASAKILEGIEKRSFRVVIGADAHLLDRLARTFPRRAANIVARQMKKVLEF